MRDGAHSSDAQSVTLIEIAADDAVMQTWLRQFMEQDAQIQRALRPVETKPDRPQ